MARSHVGVRRSLARPSHSFLQLKRDRSDIRVRADTVTWEVPARRRHRSRHGYPLGRG